MKFLGSPKLHQFAMFAEGAGGGSWPMSSVTVPVQHGSYQEISCRQGDRARRSKMTQTGHQSRIYSITSSVMARSCGGNSIPSASLTFDRCLLGTRSLMHCLFLRSPPTQLVQCFPFIELGLTLPVSRWKRTAFKPGFSGFGF